jgi:hypothetical protein
MVIQQKEDSMATQQEAKRQANRVSGVTNVTYDLLTIMTNKLEGIAALEEYKLDADEAGDTEVSVLFDRVEQRMREDIDQLRDVLATRLARVSTK